MIVYEVMVDHDMTTRSTTYSYGLFLTREAAKRKIDSLNLKDWQWRSIEEKEVIE